MSIALPIAFARRGACPTLDTPMQTGDGLLARIRLPGGRIHPGRLKRLATICGTYGNGVMEITARGNLQVRGLTAAVVPAFAEAVRQITAVETGLVVETPPLAGDDPLELADPRPLATEIRQMAAPLAARLGPKVAVIVDGNGQIGLGGLKDDLRFLAVSSEHWLVSVGARMLGTTTHPLRCAEIVLRALAALGPGARATDLAAVELDRKLVGLVAPSASVEQHTKSPIGQFCLRQGSVTGLALPFGALPWHAVAALADGAGRFEISEFRLGPHHSLLAVGADQGLLPEAASMGFITDPRDPRLRISACIGSDGCASGHVAARLDAARLAAALLPNTRLHVSGCAKGCAHPGAADITLVGGPNGYGLVIGGKAGDTPQALLQADQLHAVLAGA